ncbi:potassium-transporting ATPase subunit KdpC [Hephaestia sp. GCM10023244]|uniref:potassium-transporting ATPase subunit KdpC n=1 Tax=unclassified Hephaestia TaxID=2631281 RepID=UPI002076E4C7|nr:potassium-transporting ATPase subunit KdpC [Hephaestia sp. MAHUQ-44]MCM8730071.1 potassium-transporting ATPase subunit KdpC [Hephaestia sp. MAHUQ-44]
MATHLTTALRPAIVMTLLFAALLGLAYPALLTAIGQIAFPAQANGSLIRDGDRVIGSALIGQVFAAPRYFHGRPSAAGQGYDAAASSGSNLGPTSKALAERVAADLANLPHSPQASVPADLVTTSASGLDPHISPEAALFQVNRVAMARGLPAGQLRTLVNDHVERRLFGLLGEPRVNVLLLNRALDSMASKEAKATE